MTPNLALMRPVVNTMPLVDSVSNQVVGLSRLWVGDSVSRQVEFRPYRTQLFRRSFRLWRSKRDVGRRISGPSGVTSKITPDGATVWRYVNPAVGPEPIDQGDPIQVRPAPPLGAGPFWANNIYRAHRYAPDYPGLQYYDLTPQGTLERYRDGQSTAN